MLRYAKPDSVPQQRPPARTRSRAAVGGARGDGVAYCGVGRDGAPGRCRNRPTLALRQVLRSARRLSRAEAQIRSIADSVPALITAFDSDRRMTFVNAHAAETYGRNREELLGKTVGDVRGQAKAAEAVRPGRAPRSEDQHQYRCGRPECGRHHAPGTDCPCRPSAVPGQARGAESICRIRRQGFLIASV